MAATAFGVIEEKNEAATVKVTNLDPECDETLLWELMTQAGPLATCNIIKDKDTGDSQGMAYVEFKMEEDADYAMKILNMVKLFGTAIRIQKLGEGPSSQLIDIGANIFVGNLDVDVDEKLLADTFSTFGPLARQPHIAKESSGESRGFGFVNFENFDAADKAIDAMNGKFIMGQKVHVKYALRKDGKTEHGGESERLLAQGAQDMTHPVEPMHHIESHHHPQQSYVCFYLFV